MDIEETHEDAPRDEHLYNGAVLMAQRYADLMIAAKNIGYSLDPVSDVSDAVYDSFASAVNDAGYTEDAGFMHPRALWDNILKEAGL